MSEKKTQHVVQPGQEKGRRVLAASVRSWGAVGYSLHLSGRPSNRVEPQGLSDGILTCCASPNSVLCLLHYDLNPFSNLNIFHLALL